MNNKNPALILCVRADLVKKPEPGDKKENCADCAAAIIVSPSSQNYPGAKIYLCLQCTTKRVEQIKRENKPIAVAAPESVAREILESLTNRRNN